MAAATTMSWQDKTTQALEALVGASSVEEARAAAEALLPGSREEVPALFEEWSRVVVAFYARVAAEPEQQLALLQGIGYGLVWHQLLNCESIHGKDPRPPRSRWREIVPKPSAIGELALDHFFQGLNDVTHEECASYLYWRVAKRVERVMGSRNVARGARSEAAWPRKPNSAALRF